MQARNYFCGLAGFFFFLTGCGTADNPYSRISDPPLIQARLHTVTLASDTPAIAGTAVAAGYQAVNLPPNYQEAEAVQAGIWGVTEAVAAAAAHFRAPTGAPDLRLLVMPLAAGAGEGEASTREAFFRNVLGSDVPTWPLPVAQPENVRIQVWTYLVPGLLEARKRLRESGIPVIYDPVAITTTYLGDHKTLAIRAPDGVVVQLVEASAQ